MTNPARSGVLVALAALTLFAASGRADIDITLPMPLQANGLPDMPINGQLFRPHGTRNYFIPVQAGSEGAWHLYTVWTVGASNYYWVTGNDRRPISPGSKVQGWRLRQQGQHGKNWYTLDTDTTGWIGTKQRRHDGVWREDRFHGRVQSEVPPANWENLGGELEPPPVAEQIRCELLAFPRSIKLGEQVRLTLYPYGPVTRASIDGTPVEPRRGELVVTPQALGTVRVQGRVGDANDRVATCSTEYVVEPKVEPVRPRCEIQVAPASIRVGQFTVVTMTSVGNVKEASLDGAAMEVPTGRTTRRGDTAGRHTLNGTVKAPDGSTGTCSAQLEVLP